MRVGYSMVFGEIVAADDADYGDCAKHQITCPCCREAVFKGQRLNPGRNSQTHYFSHYHATEEDARACEMRVAALARKFIHSLSAEGRSQSLAAFFSVMQKTICAGQESLGTILADDLRRAAMKIYVRSDFDLLEAIGDEAVQNLIEAIDDPRAMIAEALSRIPVFRGRSPFWARRQASFILDVLRHIRILQSAPNKRFLIAAASVLASRHREKFLYFRQEDYSPGQTGVSIVRAIDAGKSAGAVRHLVNLMLKERHEERDAATIEEEGSKVEGELDQISGRHAKIKLLHRMEASTKKEIRLREIRRRDVESRLVPVLLSLELSGPILGLLGAARFQ